MSLPSFSALQAAMYGRKLSLPQLTAFVQHAHFTTTCPLSALSWHRSYNYYARLKSIRSSSI